MPDNEAKAAEPVNDVQKAFDALAAEAEKEQDQKRTYTFGELHDIADDETPFIIPELLPAFAVAILLGIDGIGKTQLLTQLCLQIAMGRPTFLTLPLITRHKRALIVATEDAKEKFIKAAKKIFKYLAPEVNPHDVGLKFTEAADFDDLKLLVIEVEKQLKEGNYDLIVVDAMSDLFTMIDGEINQNSDARKILGIMQMLCNRHQTTIIIVHHVAKSKIAEKKKSSKAFPLFIEKDDSQGAGAITQKPRTVLALSHDPRTITNNGLSYKNFLHVVKANLMSKFYVTKAIELNFDATNLVHNWSQLITIEDYEKGDPNTKGTQEQAPHAPDPVTQRQMHDQHLKAIFATTQLYTRGDLVEKLVEQYAIGKNRVEQKGGLFGELVEMQLIKKEGKFWAYVGAFQAPRPEPPPGFFDEGNTSLSLDDTLPPPPPDEDEGTPF